VGSTPAGRTFLPEVTGQQSEAELQHPVDYYVLKQGRQEGPFSTAELMDQMAQGRFKPEDLGHADGARHWTPLRKLITADATETGTVSTFDADADDSKPATMVPVDFEKDAKRFWRGTVGGIRELFRRYPLEMGITSLVLACTLLLLSYVRIFIVAPAILGALLGGGVAMLRGRVMAGVAVCAAAVFGPALIWAVFFWAAAFLR
jgi:hypothetical protein